MGKRIVKHAAPSSANSEPAPASFVKPSTFVLAAATAAREAVAGVEGLARGTLSIGIMQSLVAVRLPALLAQFRTLHPAVDIRLRQAGTTILLQEVREGRLELAFASLPDPAPAGLVGHELLSEEMTLVCSPEHPLAGRTEVTLADLRDEPFVDGHPPWGIRASNDRAFRDAGIERHVAFAVNDMTTILDLVAHNRGGSRIRPGTRDRDRGVVADRARGGPR